MTRVLAISLLALGSCVRVEGQLAPAATPTAPAADAPWRVGAQVVDITPPVGYGMAGHAIEARTSVGVWTRLRAQAIAIEDRDGTPVVLIAADLWAIPAGLPDAVTERLQTEHGLSTLGRAQVVLAATHTHHGPGHFHTAPGYADHAGSEPGFDAVLFEWLADRLASAAAEAYAARRPATLEHHTVAVPSLARNRSLSPLLQNPEAQALLDRNLGLPGCEHPDNATWADLEHAADPCHAVDPTLDTVVARDAETDRVLAVAAVFGVHATAMPNRTPVYHGDLFGIAARHAQAQLRANGDQDAVVAVFNGPEGDVSPNWRTQGRGATKALGHGLGEAVTASLSTDGQTLRGTVGYGLALAPLSQTAVTHPTTVEPGHTGRRALPGRSQFGGAEDGRTRMAKHGVDEGRTVRRARRKGHGAKRPAVPPPLVALLHPAAHFPSVVPIGLVELGPLAVVTLPGEVTTVMGQRIEQRVTRARPHAGPTIGIGLAGEYLSYFTTPEEYDLQHYEGASMMYGRLAGEALAEAAEQLAHERRVDGDGTFAYRGRGRTSISTLGRKVRRAAKTATAAVLDTLQTDRSVSVTFDDIPAQWDAPSGHTTPRIRVEAFTDERGWMRITDDEDDTLVTHVTRSTRARWTWAAHWLEPFAPLDSAATAFRFRIQRMDGTLTCSTPFELQPDTASLRLKTAACAASSGHDNVSR